MTSSEDIKREVEVRLLEIEQFFLSHRLLDLRDGKNMQLRMRFRGKIVELTQEIEYIMDEEDDQNKTELDESIDFINEVYERNILSDVESSNFVPDVEWDDYDNAMCLRCGFEWDGNAQHRCEYE